MMPIDPKNLSPDEARFHGSGWSLFVKMKDLGWRWYCPVGGRVMNDFTTAREMYEIAVRDPTCLSALLVEMKTVAGFNKGEPGSP